MNNSSLNLLRSRVDTLDTQIIQLLATRMIISKEIGKVKSVLNLPPLQIGRWQEVLQDRIKKGQKLGLRETFVQHIWETIHQESLHQQRKEKTC
ncbi:MAG: chorismate mutase [Patescibacteria group bacterium]